MKRRLGLVAKELAGRGKVRVTNVLAVSSGKVHLDDNSGVLTTTGNYRVRLAAGESVEMIGPVWGICTTDGNLINVSIVRSDISGRGNDPVLQIWPQNRQQKGATASGTDTTFTANTAQLAQVRVNKTSRFTGVKVLNGTTVGTDKLIGVLYDRNGSPLAYSAKAGITSSGAEAYQTLAFGKPILVTDGIYYIGVVANGTTATVQVTDASAGIAGATSVVAGTVASAVDFTNEPIPVSPPLVVGASVIACLY